MTPHTGAYGYVVHHHHRYRIEGPATGTPVSSTAHGRQHGAHSGLATNKPPAVYTVPSSGTPAPNSAHRAKAPPAAAGVANTATTNTAGSSTEAQRYADLQTALTAAVAQNARLAPSPPLGAQTTDVTLTLPSDFAQTIRTEAARQDLSDQAASVNVGATLTGDGYAITPAEAQAQPLTLGEQTVFHWRVTPQQNARGPLQANARIDVLSAGRSLPLGAVTSSTGAKWTGRVVGVGLLVLIALALLAWAAQRKRPTASGAARPRENHQNGV